MDNLRTGIFFYLVLLLVLQVKDTSSDEINRASKTGNRVLEVDPDLGRPRRVSAEVEGTNSILLSWQAPEMKDGKCPVRRYHIRLRAEGDKRSRSWKIDGARTSLTLHDLLEDTNYFVRLMAVACKGKGAHTRWIEVHTGTISTYKLSVDSGPDLQTPGMPINVRTRTMSTSVIVSWAPPPDGTEVRGYKVGYSEGVPDLNWRYVGAEQRNITIQNLKPGTEYVISLCARNNYGEGPVVYELIYTRNEINSESTENGISPLAAPENVRAKVLTHSTVWLQWTDPNLGRNQQLTDTRYYNVHYQALPNGKTLSLIVKALHVVLYDLLPGTTYSFKIRTVKDSASSHFSETTRNRTFETVPSTPPRTVTVLPTNDSSAVHLAWRSPRTPNGYVTAYLVLYTTDQALPLNEWEVFAVPGANTQVVMSALKTNTTYYFKIQARNSMGYGPSTNTLVYHTSPTTQSLKNKTPFTVKDREINEVDFEDGNPAIEVEYPDYSNDDNNPNFESLVGSESDYRGNEVSGSHGREQQDEGQTSEHDLELSFQYVVKHTVSVVVRWEEPCHDKTYYRRLAPPSYMIRYYPQDNPNSFTDKITPTNFVLLDNLRPNHKYAYIVKRTDGDVETNWSREGYLDTTHPNET